MRGNSKKHQNNNSGNETNSYLSRKMESMENADVSQLCFCSFRARIQWKMGLENKKYAITTMKWSNVSCDNPAKNEYTHQQNYSEYRRGLKRIRHDVKDEQTPASQKTKKKLIERGQMTNKCIDILYYTYIKCMETNDIVACVRILRSDP